MLRRPLLATTTFVLLILLPWSAGADLDPAIQADLHLVAAEDYIKQKNYAAAQEAMGKILALQEKHDLTIPVEFHFKYAQVLDLAGQNEDAVAAVTHYLEIAGRGGGHYREALALLHRTSQSAEKAEAKAAARPRAAEVARSIAMVVVPASTYLMGFPEEADWIGAARPRHRVTIPKPFLVGVYEVTFEQWDACVSVGGCDGHAPDDAGWGRGRRPVINVSWEDAQRFVAWLRKETGEPYRLLSEAEWEYVARAGTTTPFHTGSTISTSQANYEGEQTVEVGTFAPNYFGLYDIHGNVSEWVDDCWNNTYRGAPSDGNAWRSGDCSHRMIRGGSWSNHGTDELRSADRDHNGAGYRMSWVGFRVARTLTP